MNTQRPIKFVIYGMPRVGSNYLISLLNNFRDILCHYEIFHQNDIYTAFDEKKIDCDNFSSIIKRNEDPISFLTNIFDSHFNHKAVGYNLFLHQDNRAYENSIKDTTQLKIILKRKNILKSYISYKLAEESNCWTSREKTSNTKSMTSFIAEEFEKRAYWINNLYFNLEKLLSISGQNYFVIYYEDILSNRDSELNRLRAYLGLTKSIVNHKIELQKQNTDDIRLILSNYDDFNSYFENIMKNLSHTVL